MITLKLDGRRVEWRGQMRLYLHRLVAATQLTRSTICQRPALSPACHQNVGSGAGSLNALASAAAQAGDPDRARRLLALALSAESPEIGSWVEGVSHFFPSVIRGAGDVFISAYKTGRDDLQSRSWPCTSRRRRMF
jgi:hypothetical protein